ncbi:PilZ domain-containing protein [Pontixanthobacter sp. CEM42]|uniref:PilZ domain-containing protein n=1 Tax=Pontixanthobacter sp. CEM42 TaxID=2792077 RepID=UPI001AE0935E|nr:PilZ domain-containing protein [Pontixanthobacter sp. CEM42]
MSDGRRTPRFDISVQGRYRTGSGVARDVPILEMSETGCRFYDRFGRLAPGAELTLKIGPIGPVVAIVRWCKEQIVGVEFEYPLYGPVFEHIRSQLDQGKPDDSGYRPL